VNDECTGREDDRGEGIKRMLVTFKTPVKTVYSLETNLHATLRKLLEVAYAMKLCSCKQWFAAEGGSSCASCLAAVALGAADSCTICYEPAAKRTRCCKRAMHLACHVQHGEHAPPPHGFAPDAWRAGEEGEEGEEEPAGRWQVRSWASDSASDELFAEPAAGEAAGEGIPISIRGAASELRKRACCQYTQPIIPARTKTIDARRAIAACKSSIYTKEGKGCGRLNEVVLN
jgi:hypothetical protein